MKKLLALFVFAFLGMGIAQAQTTPTSQNPVTTQVTQKVLDKLELTPEQSQKIGNILEALAPMIQNIKSSDLNAVSKAKKLATYADRERANMEVLLSEEQYAKYLKLTDRS